MLEDFKTQADEFCSDGKDRMKCLKEEWQKIQDDKLEKERLKWKKCDKYWRQKNGN